MTITDIKGLIAINMGRSTVSDLVLNGFDTGLYALNAARRVLERAHDFRYAETNVFLSIGASGGLLTDAYADASVTIAGTLSPNVAGAFTRAGTYNGLPFFVRTTGGADYFLSSTGSAWRITTAGLTLGSNYWSLTTTAASPAGTYAPTGTNTGTATVTNVTGTVGIKRVATVALPVAGSEYLPIEFLTNDEWLARLKRQIGRTTYDSTRTLAQLGVATGNPLAYQNGQTLFLYPSDLTLPIVTQLNVTRWMPDYTAGTDTDFFTLYAPEALMWQAVLDCNKYWRRFIDKQEANVDEAAVKIFADEARASLIEWDMSVCRGTSTPNGKPTTPEG